MPLKIPSEFVRGLPRRADKCDAGLREAWARVGRYETWRVGLSNVSDDDVRATTAAQDYLISYIADTPARTAAGLEIKLRMLRSTVVDEEGPELANEALLDSALAALSQIGSAMAAARQHRPSRRKAA